MPYLIVTSLYPSDKLTEVVNKYFEAMGKYPPDEKLATRLVSAVRTTLRGIQNIAVSKVKKGKLEEAISYAGSMMAMFNNIQGFECKIDTFLTVEEALGIIGMNPPK